MYEVDVLSSDHIQPDKTTVLDKTYLVVQRAIMESNCLIDTEVILNAIAANKLLLINGFLDWKREHNRPRHILPQQ